MNSIKCFKKFFCCSDSYSNNRNVNANVNEQIHRQANISQQPSIHHNSEENKLNSNESKKKKHLHKKN